MTSPLPWSRLDKEPAQWFARFDVFRELGPGRTMEECYRRSVAEGKSKPSKTKRPHVSWYEASERWNWKARAEAWDAHVKAERDALLDSERRTRWDQDRRKAQESRRQVVQALDGLLRKIIQSKANDMNERELKDLATAARAIFQESRLEFGEATTISENRVSGVLATKNVDELTDSELLEFIQSR